MPQQFGLIAVMNNAELDAREQSAIVERRANESGQAAQSDQYAHLVTRLGSYIEQCWEAARSAKESHVEPEMLEDLRQREGEYSPAKLAEIRKQGGSEIFMMLTNAKCRAAEAWFRDILSADRPFTVKPSPVPEDLPDDIKQGIVGRVMAELQQALQSGIYVTPEDVYQRSRKLYDEVRARALDEARKRAERMEDRIDDLFTEGQWYDALDAMIPDLVTLPAAFIKGPVVRKTSRLTWVPGPGGKEIPQAHDELVPMFYSPSAFDMYPAPDSKAIDDGYLFERIRSRRSAIHRMIGVPGYKEDAIRAALQEHQRGGANLSIAGEQERRDLENAHNWELTPDHALDILEFHGSVRGEWLIEWGMPAEQVPDKDAEYEISALKLGRFVIRAVLNEDPLRRRPYDKACYDEIKGQFWGRGLPRLIRDCQTVCNAAARALVNNMGMGSGPMAEVEVDRLAEGEDITNMHPWRIVQTKASKTTPAPAVRWFMPPLVVRDLMGVYQQFSALADSYSGVPQYEQGVNPTQGAGGTASGFSMLLNISNRLFKRVLIGVDKCIKGSATRAHHFIMLFMDAPEAKGDANIVAKGASSLVAKEQLQLRRAQFVQTTANPIDMQILGPVGRAELLRDTMKTLDYAVDDILPTKDEMLAQMQQQAQMQAAMAGAGRQPPAAPATDAAGNVQGGAERALFAA